MLSELGAGSTLAGRYALGEVLGRGGMGEVWEGRDLRLGRPVAIKLLDPAVAAQPRARERFEAEARAAARLSHPNIVVVYDSGEHEGVPYLVMERLPGRTLADELADGPLSPDRARTVAIDILAALGAAHDAGVVHRDVKPGNVLLSSDGTAKVGDFGIAKAVDDVDLTTTGLLLGTPAYLSPEQVAGEPATPASDIYSVGVVLYEALSGTKPFVAGSPLALAHAVSTQPPAPLTETRPDAPPELVAAITKAMEKEPSRRFASAAEMAAALSAPARALVAPTPASREGGAGAPTARISATQRLHVGADATPGQVLAPARHHRRWVIAVAALAATILLLTVVFTAGGGDQREGERTVTPTSVTAVRGSVPPELGRALERLDEVTQP